MTDKEKRCQEEIQRCRTSIEREKQIIESHKEMLKNSEKRETELLAKLEALKLQDLKSLISKRGYNIDDLREAMIAGDLSSVVPQNPAEKNAERSEISAPTADNIPKQEYTLKSDEEDTSLEDNKSVVLADINQSSETDNNN